MNISLQFLFLENVESGQRGEGDGSEEVPEKPVDVTERILERRNHSAQVELDLRKLQIELLNNQVDMLKMFLPKSFHTRGGDSDGVNIELLMLRISNKARIVQTHAFERFRLDQPTGSPAQVEIGKESQIYWFLVHVSNQQTKKCFMILVRIKKSRSKIFNQARFFLVL